MNGVRRWIGYAFCILILTSNASPGPPDYEFARSCIDVDRGGDITLSDYAQLQAAFTG